MIDFYHTHGGRRFIDVTAPELVVQLKRIADVLGRLVELTEASKESYAAPVKKEGA